MSHVENSSFSILIENMH